MDLFNLPPKCRKNAILYYCGSFDPAHKGQLSNIQSALEKTKAIGAVVIVAQGENSEKPNRSSWEIRRQTALELFGQFNNICVSPWGKELTKKYLLDNAYVINLMGEDVWKKKYCKKTKSDFQGICIGLRHSKNTDYATNLKDTEIIYTAPEIEGCSSSKIRNYLNSHPEIYEGAAPASGTILERLTPSELDYIVKNKIYYQRKQPAHQKALEKIKCYIKNALSFIEHFRDT